jgi:hypothetical protein
VEKGISQYYSGTKAEKGINEILKSLGGKADCRLTPLMEENSIFSMTPITGGHTQIRFEKNS